MKVHLKDSFGGNVVRELSEYLSQNPKVKAPRKLKKNTLLDWRIDNNIENLIRVKLKEDDVRVFINQKGGKQTKTSYPSSTSGKSEEEIKKALDKAHAKVTSVLRESVQGKSSLYQEDFIPNWDSTYLEAGLVAGSGLTFLSNASPLLIQAGVFVRISPGALSENYDIDFLSDFTHPLLKPILFNFSFGFTYTLPASVDVLRDAAGGVLTEAIQNNFAFQIYSLSLGAAYSYTFQKRMRLLTGVSLAYYLSPAKANLSGNVTTEGLNINVGRASSRLAYAPAFLVNTAFQYLLFSYLSLGSWIEYTHYFGSSFLGSSSNFSQISLNLEVAYVF